MLDDVPRQAARRLIISAHELRNVQIGPINLGGISNLDPRASFYHYYSIYISCLRRTKHDIKEMAGERETIILVQV